MKALVKTRPGVGHLELIDLPEPECGPGDVKIEVSGCGICGTDLLVRDDVYRNFPPVVLGHEFAGTVVQLGAAVSGFTVGQPVAVLPSSAITCGACLACRTGRYMHCADRRGMGHGTSGGLTRFVLVRPHQVYPLPAHLSLDEAALAEPIACAVHAVVEIARPVVGDVALVSGPGSIGLMCLKLLVASGVRTIVSGSPQDESRLQVALRLGAAAVVNVANDDLAAVVARETGGRGVDVAFEVAGVAASVQACLAAVRRQGRLIQVGVCGADVPLSIKQILLKEVDLRGSLAHSVDTWDRVMRLFEQRVVRFDDLITHRLPLTQWQDGMALVERREGIKVVLVP